MYSQLLVIGNDLLIITSLHVCSYMCVMARNSWCNIIVYEEVCFCACVLSNVNGSQSVL